ncbi:MAG: hypothetical protein J6W00_05815 [Lentisphaeria bacterium]|nr:hypothetical protein [Lentisphaeria bacterium]
MKKSIVAICTVAMLGVSASEFIRPQLVCGKGSENFRKVAKLPEDFNRKPIESTSVKASYDKDNLYLEFIMDDDDTLTEAEKNQTQLRSAGDSLQLFFKSEKETWLWEFQLSPNGKKSCFFHYGAGRMFYPEADSKFPDFKVVNKLAKGKWNVNVTIPLSIFREKGFKFTKDEKWTFMFVRHNFSRFHNERDTSSYPQAVHGASNPQFFGELVL